MVEPIAPDTTMLTADTPLRRGWTTGACAAAAAKAAALGLGGDTPAAVDIPLPGGQRPCFAVAREARGPGWAEAAVVKDAGDDPDVTHGATVVVRLAPGPPGSGLVFRAGEGVGTATRPGLPIAPGEPAINPGPRAMIAAALAETDASRDLFVTVSIPDGVRIAERTLNSRLGICGGLSILGTTGVVIPFSCAAWIDTIHRGIDVARACGLAHVVGATGTTSEQAAQRLFDLPDTAMIEMGDFAGGLLKYLRRHPIAHVTIAGGFAKMTKLGQGLLDLHSKRGSVDLGWLAARASDAGATDDIAGRIEAANTAAEALALADRGDIPLGSIVAAAARRTAASALGESVITLDVAIFSREGSLICQVLTFTSFAMWSVSIGCAGPCSETCRLITEHHGREAARIAPTPWSRRGTGLPRFAAKRKRRKTAAISGGRRFRSRRAGVKS